MTSAKPVGGDYSTWRDAQPKAVWHMPAMDAAVEHRFRQFALPIALLVAWAVVHMNFMHLILRTVFSMWIHELGHAVSAWLCGRFAFPGPWFTPIGAQRSWIMVVVIAGSIGYGVFHFWRSRKSWAAFLIAILLLQVYCTFLLPNRKAMSFIVWAGDGGCMIIGTLLMLSLYARKRSQLRVGWLRWGFLVIGAAAFADGFATWWAARTDREVIPFGENEGRGPSDPTVLIFQQGFSIPELVTGYVWVGFACLAVLLAAYLLGLRREGECNEEEET
jgi:drug/metabolite transporter superfamily protein YnfA